MDDDNNEVDINYSTSYNSLAHPIYLDTGAVYFGSIDWDCHSSTYTFINAARFY